MENLGYKKIEPSQIEDNLIDLIASDWMLVTAGDKEKFNTMTASWGGAGYLWNKPVVFVFVRPQRYTYQFTESNNLFTLSFFDRNDEKSRNALKICGSKSGRDCDKVAEAKLVPQFTTLGNPTFKGARMVIECRKLYAELLRHDSFIDEDVYHTHYGSEDSLHKMYISEIINVWVLTKYNAFLYL